MRASTAAAIRRAISAARLAAADAGLPGDQRYAVRHRIATAPRNLRTRVLVAATFDRTHARATRGLTRPMTDAERDTLRRSSGIREGLRTEARVFG